MIRCTDIDNRFGNCLPVFAFELGLRLVSAVRLCMALRMIGGGGGSAVRNPRVRAVALAAAVGMLARLSDRRDVARRLLRGCGSAECRPLLHQPAPLLEHVAALVGLLHLVADDMRQCGFHNLILNPRAARSPRAYRSGGSRVL